MYYNLLFDNAAPDSFNGRFAFVEYQGSPVQFTTELLDPASAAYTQWRTIIEAVVSLELVVFSAGVRITTIIEAVVILKLVVVSAGVRITAIIEAVVSLELVVFSPGIRITTIIETVVRLKLVVFSAGVRITAIYWCSR